MLVLSREVEQSIVINGNVIITVLRVNGDKVRLGIEAPDGVPVHRKEIQNQIEQGTSR